jgi:uncharacterized membrane protein
MYLVIFVSVALILIGVATPLVMGRVPPNDLYGLRVPATMQDEEVWYRANASAGRDFIMLGLFEIVFAAGLAVFIPLETVAYTLINAVFLVAGVVFTAVVGWRRANRMLRERRGL